MGAEFRYLKGCPKCYGDLVLDQGDWRCWQCGQYYYATEADHYENSVHEPGEPPGPPNFEPILAPDIGHPEGRPGKGRRKGYGPRSTRNIDAVIRANQVSNERWQARNRHIIENLDQGISVRQIARLAERGERQIRVIRERLADLRAASEGLDEKKTRDATG